MIVYFSYPFAINDKNTMQRAANELAKLAGFLAREQPHCVATSALFEAYDVPFKPVDPRGYYLAGKLLIDAADKIIVVRAPGWEYCEIMHQEVGYGMLTKKPIVYVDPIPPKIKNGEQKLQ